MIRIILMIGIVVCCVLIGNMIKNCLFVRCQIFKDFKGLCKSISNEITFLKTDKFTMLNNREFLDKRSAEIIHNYLLLGKVDCAYLKNAENKALNDFLNSIGKMDVDGEINLSEIESKNKDLEVEIKKLFYQYNNNYYLYLEKIKEKEDNNISVSEKNSKLVNKITSLESKVLELESQYNVLNNK